MFHFSLKKVQKGVHLSRKKTNIHVVRRKASQLIKVTKLITCFIWCFYWSHYVSRNLLIRIMNKNKLESVEILQNLALDHNYWISYVFHEWIIKIIIKWKTTRSSTKVFIKAKCNCSNEAKTVSLWARTLTCVRIFRH